MVCRNGCQSYWFEFLRCLLPTLNDLVCKFSLVPFILYEPGRVLFSATVFYLILWSLWLAFLLLSWDDLVGKFTRLGWYNTYESRPAMVSATEVYLIRLSLCIIFRLLQFTYSYVSGPGMNWYNTYESGQAIVAATDVYLTPSVILIIKP